MSDDRPVHTDALRTLGQIIDDKQGRDAIHIAVEPVIAGMTLRPGENIHLTNGEAFLTAPEQATGIVDPFLRSTVVKGQRFWLLVMPRTITSLRHVWEHPAFPLNTTEKSASEQWMRQWAMRHVSEDYYGDEHGKKLSEDQAYAFAIEAGHDHSIGPYEDARDHINDEWWDNWEAITGCRGNRGEYFSCSC